MKILTPLLFTAVAFAVPPLSTEAPVGPLELSSASQQGGGWGGWGGRQGGRSRGRRGMRDDRGGVEMWEVDPEFRHDTFVFARVRYSENGRRWSWDTDYPDSDLNFSYRLKQLTSLDVDPEGVIVEFTDEHLADYPFTYVIEPGSMALTRPEIEGMRHYCLNGGFVMVDDFWGDEEWYVFEQNMKLVFPDRAIVDLPLSHEIFHNVYDLQEKPQIPSIGVASSGRSYEERRWSDTSQAHYRAIFDDQGRIMVMICFNTDLGDGWEREGEAQWFFEEYSEKKAYPMGINIVTYALTH